jgi:hypothetical protein
MCRRPRQNQRNHTLVLPRRVSMLRLGDFLIEKERRLRMRAFVGLPRQNLRSLDA